MARGVVEECECEFEFEFEFERAVACARVEGGEVRDVTVTVDG